MLPTTKREIIDNIAENLTRMADDAGLEPTVFARQNGVHPFAFLRLLRRTSFSPRLPALCKIANALKVSLDAIIGKPQGEFLTNPPANVDHRAWPYDDDYLIGADGSVWTRKNKARWIKLRPRINSWGYRTIGINGRTKKVAVLVLETFVGPRPGKKMHSCHNDGKRDNDAVENLRWDTASENAKDIARTGGQKARCTHEEVRAVMALANEGLPYKEIASRLGISKGRACYINKYAARHPKFSYLATQKKSPQSGV